MSDLSPEPIIQVASGYMAAKQLFVAVEIGLFERLAGGPTNLDELAQRMGIPRRTLRIVTDTMVALGLLERVGDRYRNGASAAAFLSGSGGPDLRPFLQLLNGLSYPRWVGFEEAVRTYKHLECTLYDLPQVAAATLHRLTSDPWGAHIQVVAGDFFKDSIPEGHDGVIIAKHRALLRGRSGVASSPAGARACIGRSGYCSWIFGLTQLTHSRFSQRSWLASSCSRRVVEMFTALMRRSNGSRRRGGGR